jgi:hypothetical protein
MACCRTRNDMVMYSSTHDVAILTGRLDRLVSVCSRALITCRVYNLVQRCMYPCANTLYTAHIILYTYTTHSMVLPLYTRSEPVPQEEEKNIPAEYTNQTESQRWKAILPLPNRDKIQRYVSRSMGIVSFNHSEPQSQSQSQSQTQSYS